ISRNSGGAVPIDGGLGEIPSGGVGPIPVSTLRSESQYQIATELLNCRDSPGTQSNVVTRVPLGTLVFATEEPERPRVAFAPDGAAWLLVRANVVTCHASGDVKFITPLSSGGSSGAGTSPGQGPIPFSTLNAVDRYQVVTDLLNCRENPGTTEGVVSKLP